MEDISCSVRKKDHVIKMNGTAEYVADKKVQGMLYASLVRSSIAYGKIKSIQLPELPEGYYSVQAKDIPGANHLKVITEEQPIFADEEVRYVGEAILLIAGPDKEKARELAERVMVTYEEKIPVLSLQEATQASSAYHYKKGNPEQAFAMAKEVIEETFFTDYQEQAYIEPQGCIGIYQNGKITIYGSLQCPYYVKSAVMEAMDLDEEHVQVVQTVTGGGFGGKEDYPSLIGCQAAVAARKTGRPVRIIHNRREDMSVTPKRHPAKLVYRAALNEKNEITAIQADIKLDAGAYPGLSSVVLQRSLIAATGVYNICNLDISGQAMLTNLVSNGAYRGFGAPQSFFAIESFMNHIAKKIGIPPLKLREKYFVRQGNFTSTNGQFHHYVPLPDMVAKAELLSDYSKKHARYAKPQTGRYRRGIGMSIFLHGCGFTGSQEKDFIKSKVKLVKYEDDRVEILASNTDIGQGLKTTFGKIVAQVLEIPLSQVIIVNPDTDRVPNSGPTVASRSLMIVGKLLERAAVKMKKEWVSGKSMEIIEHYQHPDMIPWDMETFQGDAYPTYSYGVNVVEVETDMLLATTKLTGVWGIFDVGKAIDQTIMIGQAQGGMLQGIGYGSMEKMETAQGRIKQNSFTDYMIPTSMDTVPFEIAFIDNLYEEGPFGAKGAGELTLIGSAPAYAAAVEQAVGKSIYAIPVTPERLMEVMEND